LLQAEDAPDPAPLSDELLEMRRARVQLDLLLDSMSIELRTVFILHELEQVAMSEIATMLGVPSGTVASRLRRARQVFREGVKGLDGGFLLGGQEP
jgi:RNA polymerase sigma-70 factor (ECF subfamily)